MKTLHFIYLISVLFAHIFVRLTVLLIPYLCFISFLYLDSNVLGDDT